MCHRQNLHLASDLSLLSGDFAPHLRLPRQASTARLSLLPHPATTAYHTRCSLNAS